MSDMYENCYSCGKTCVETAFCSEGASYDTTQTDGISLPRNLKIKVIANPDFWGFSGVLIEGWARYENGYFDFFDGFDENHSEMKTCGSVEIGPLKNEQRPDVFYRSVYDPDTGSKHYGSDGTEEFVERGGAEVYLVDRQKSLIEPVSSDNPSCDHINPTQVFKKFPENFGFGNKINFKEGLYKNITGAWRLVDIGSCTPNSSSDFIAKECDRTYKENILKHRGFLTESDPYGLTSQLGRDCIADGAVPSVQSGDFLGNIYRSGEGLLNCNISYFNGPVLGISVGSQILFKDINNYDKMHVVADFAHNLNSTTIQLAGTWASGIINISTSGGSWYLPNTFDEQSCCGKAVYGIDYDTKKPTSEKNYHLDFGKIINNNKNYIQSNRFPENRETFNLPKISPINSGARKDYTYIDLNDSGNAIPGSFSRELPYYGNFYNTDRFDNTVRSDHKYNTITGRNLTCYSKKATLDIFPDCVTQHLLYNECQTNAEKYSINRVKRLGFVYRGCNFYDPCSFNESGLPLKDWEVSAPTGIEDLKRGLAGQEIYMYINLSPAWGGEITRCQCDCSDSPPIGTKKPSVVNVPSPVTFPCFPKFDLDPHKYGCEDVRFQMEMYKRHISVDFDHEPCDPFPTHPAICMERQPYTTYGFMRNLCGKNTQNRKDIITAAFAKIVQDGLYRNTKPEVSIDEPMYWEFFNSGPTPPIFNTGDWNGSASNGFGNSGNYPYWGLSDSNGRLIAPYFQAKRGVFSCCPTSSINDFVDFDSSGTYINDWPKNNVPFLIEIDHEDSCVGCVSSNMTDQNLMLTLESLSTLYSHNQGNTGNGEGGKYGYNNCKYTQEASLDPSYICSSGHELHFCGSGTDRFYEIVGQPYIGETCACVSGTDIVLKPKKIKGSDYIIGWISDNKANSFVHLTGCNNLYSDLLNVDYLDGQAGGYSVYGSFRLSCPENLNYVDEPRFPYAFYQGSSVTNFWSCNTASCNRPHPAAGGKLKLNARFYVISDARKNDFEALTEADLIGPNATDIITNGIKVGSPIDAYRNIEICPGERVYAYGCGIGGSFYPCQSCTPVSTCDSCEDYGIGCNSCGEIISFSGLPQRRAPINYELNPCKCACKDPTLMRIYEMSSSGVLNLIESYEPYGCVGTIYWLAISGEERGFAGPWLREQGPPFPYIGIGPFSVDAEDFCSFQTGVNAIASGIKYKINQPYKDACGQLSPTGCDVGTCVDPRSRSAVCGDPIPYYTGDGLSVIRKSCYPETMVVNKVECIYHEGETKFNLTVSREYHGHDRTWYKKLLTPEGTVCTPLQTGAYNNGVCEKFHWASITDTVTPAYEGVCSVHKSSGIHANQDYLLDTGNFWNYYNVYEPIGPYYLPSVDENCNVAPTLINRYIFTSGQETNKKYSCIQDIEECGSELFCNKLFFPRRSYKKNTKITPFGALQICTENARLGTPTYYGGNQDITNNKLIREAVNSRFIDPCKPKTSVLLEEDISINDTQIIVKDYLPLIGITQKDWYKTSDLKSCIIPLTGSCEGITLPPTLSNDVINHMYYGPLDKKYNMGYYFDETVQESDNCLFNQFKILVDVECCSDTVRLKDDKLNKPTLLNYAFTNIPSAVCRGTITEPACSCEQSTCSDINYKPGICVPYYLVAYSYNSVSCGPNQCVSLSSPTYIGKKILHYGNSLFTESPVTCQISTDCNSSVPVTATYYRHPCFPGKELEITGPYYTRVWICEDTGYLIYPSTDSTNEDCCFISSAGLCSAINNGVKFNINASCIILESSRGFGDVGDPQEDWKNKCGCTFKKGEDVPCSDNSLMKAIITEIPNE